MKKLTVRYTNDNGDSITLYDGEVAEIGWTDGAESLRVEAKTCPRRARQGSSGNASAGMNLLEMLTGGSKARTEAMVEEKRSELRAEKKAAAKPRAAAKPPVVVVDADDDPAEAEPTIADLVEPV